jgi:hypothetical protein
MEDMDTRANVSCNAPHVMRRSEGMGCGDGVSHGCLDARMSHPLNRAIALHSWLTTNTPGCAAKECGGLELDCSIELADSQRTARAESVGCAYCVW